MDSDSECSAGFENGGRVPVVGAACAEFDFAEAEARELRELVEARVESECAARMAEAVKQVLLIIMDAKYPRRAAYMLAYGCGMNALIGGSAASLARKFGVSRQAWEQDSRRLLGELGLRKNGLEKSPDAARKYSERNYRKGGG